MNTRKKTWQPPFCPNPNCQYHYGLKENWAYKKAGTFRRHTPPHRIQRFTCQHCGRSFSSQTFSTTYWQKLPDLDRRLYMKINGSMCNRQAARSMEVAPSSIDRHISRLGRHCLLFHLKQMQGAKPPTEVVVDGFESFEWSQYFPMHHNLAVEKDTDFLISFNDSPLRRKGRMTDHQKRRRAELEEQLGRPDPKAIEKDMADLLRVTLKGTASAVVYSDNHRAYPRAIKQVDCLIKQVVTPGKQHRDKHNRLWAVNLLDLIIRHCQANHKRETLAWSKRRQSSAERLAILMVWRNYMKPRSEKDPRGPTPAMARGMLDRKLDLDDLFAERIFPSQLELPERWEQYYRREIETAALPVNRRHELKYAF